MAGLSFGDTVAKVQRGGRPLTIGFGPPPFQLEEDAVERLREADEQQQEPDGPGAAGGEGAGPAGEQSLPHHWEANKAQGTYVALPSVGMRGLGMLGMAIRAAADEQGRRCGRVKKGQRLHALDTLVRRRSDIGGMEEGETPDAYLRDEQLSEVWIKIHCVGAPKCEGWCLVRRGADNYLEYKGEDASPAVAKRALPPAVSEKLAAVEEKVMAMPKVGAKAQKLKSGGSRFKGWLKEKKGLSRSEEAHVRQLILEREKKASEYSNGLSPPSTAV